jgi:Tol biopolymer transport system component
VTRMRAIAIVGLAFTIAILAGGAHGATLAPLSASQPAWSSDGTRLAFSGALAGSERSDIYVIRFDGNGLANVTAADDEPNHLYPSWAPGAGLIASGTELGGPNTNHEVYSVTSAVDGTTRHVATSTAIGPISWSHDRHFLAIDDHESVIVARTDGTGEHVVVGGGGSGIWSPRIDRLVAAREYSGARPSIDLVLVDVAGKVLRRLTRPPKHLPKGAPLDTGNEPRAWSRDGGKILFYSTRAAQGGLYLMRADGSHVRRVATARYGDISPRGTAVVYSGKGIWVVGSNGKGRHRLSPNGQQPRWSPDGQWIAYTVRRANGVGGIDILRPDGTRRHALVGG